MRRAVRLLPLASGIATGAILWLVYAWNGDTGQNPLSAASTPAPTSGSRLRVGFAASAGAYLTNVRVAVHDASGSPVANMVAAGPWIEVSLVPGRYHVSATFEGETRYLRDLQLIEGDLITRMLYWDLNYVPTELMASHAPVGAGG